MLLRYLGLLATIVYCKAWFPTRYRSEANTRYIFPTTIPKPNVTTGTSELSKALGATFPPCCSDTITTVACKRLQLSNPSRFLERCKHDADFSLIQCCNMCGLESAADRYEVFFADGEHSPDCFDRHSGEFCERFLQRQDVWGQIRGSKRHQRWERQMAALHMLIQARDMQLAKQFANVTTMHSYSYSTFEHLKLLPMKQHHSGRRYQGKPENASKWSCDGQYANLAFRICRKSCNYCRRDIYRTNLGRFQPVACGKEPILLPHF